MKFLVAIFALMGLIAPLATLACEHDHGDSSHACHSSHQHLHVSGHSHEQEDAISGFEDHIDHWSSHRHQDGSPCSCYDQAPSESHTSSLPSPPVRLPLFSLAEVTPLVRVDLRIPPAQAPPLELKLFLSSYSARISQEICVFLL